MFTPGRVLPSLWTRGRTRYSGIERGVRNVSLVNIEKVAKGLRKSLPELFSRV
jgi:hypothetical protein